MDIKQKKWIWISIGISMVILLIVIILSFNEDTIRFLRGRYVWAFLVLAFCFHMAAMCIWALRILLMCRSLGYYIPFRHCLNMVCAGQLVASITPSQIGGEPVRIHELYKAKMPLAEATAVVLVERLIEAVMLLFFVIVSVNVVFTIVFINEEVPWVVTSAAWVSTGFLVLLLTIVVALLSQPNLIRKIVFYFVGLFTTTWDGERIAKLTEQIDEGIDRMYLTFRMFFGKAKMGLIFGFLLTLPLWVCEWMVASIILISLGYQPNLLLSVLFQLIIATMLIIPSTPGGAGVAEIGYATFYSMVLPPPLVGVFVVMLRLILYYSNLFIGFIASFLIVRREVAHRMVKGLKGGIV